MWRSAVQVCLGLHFDAFEKSINVFQVVQPETHEGGLAQLARALAWHARGHRFDPDILHLSPYAATVLLPSGTEIFDIL